MRSHLLALGLAAFWLLPAIVLSSDLTFIDVEEARTDFLSLLLHRALPDLVQSMRAWASGTFPGGDPVPLLVLLLAAVLIGHHSTRKSPVLAPFAAFVLAATIVFSSRWTAASLPIGLHQYRLVAYSVLFALCLLSAVPAAVLATRPAGRGATLLRSVVCVVSVICIGSTLASPHFALVMLRQEDPGVLLREQRDVLEYFASQRPKGRVLFERLNRQRGAQPPTPHYLSSRLFEETGFESVNGLFVQSSLAWVFPLLSAEALGANMYGFRFVRFPESGFPPDVAIEHLRSLGVTHIVFRSEALGARSSPSARIESRKSPLLPWRARHT